jgi:hypothetical protein
VRAEPGAIVVALDAGPFAAVRDQLGGYVTSVWQSAGRHVEIDWTTTAQNPEAYRFVVEDGVNGRAFVDRQTKTVHLFAGVQTRSIAHEVGHVLGLPDYYYTSWDAGTCRYTDEFNEENLMSDATAGVVTDDEWDALRALYPEPAAPGA